MQTTIQGIELSVAILMDDLACAKDIATALRQQNILAHHYQSLDEYWVAVSIQVPDLTIADVTKMSQGSIQFKSHPRVQDKSLTYAFFSKDSTKILLQSTLGLNPIAYLHNDVSLNSQVLGLVTRVKNEIHQAKVKAELESRVHRLQTRSQRLISDRSNAEEFRAHFDFIRNFCAEIEDDATRQDFTNSLIAKFEKWEVVDGFGIYELNQNGQRLISPEVTRNRYQPFPSLWLGQTNTHGIEFFAQEMATQVANDLFEIAPVSIRVHAGSTNPDLLIFVSFREERMLNFPWDVFETCLSSSLRRLKLYKQLPQYSSQFLPMWEALDNMDRLQDAGAEADVRIVALSLIPLADVAKRRTTNKFFWSSFFNDFFLQLSGRLQKSTKLSLFGPWHVLFFIPRENVEIETQMLQAFIKQFSFWKFFDDNSQILSEDMMPVLKLIPASSAHYLRIFEKEFEDMGVKEEGKRLMNIARGPAPKNTKRLTV
jgi:hypothetical protein